MAVLEVEPEKVRTNILMAGIARTGLDSSVLTERLKDAGVLVSALDATRLRLVTHNDVNREEMYSSGGHGALRRYGEGLGLLVAFSRQVNSGWNYRS